MKASSQDSPPPPKGATEPPPRLARLAVDYAAIVANWRTFRQRAPKAEIAAVVKADAYGLGAAPAARALAEAGARTFFTATSGEGLAVRRSVGAGPRIFVLNGPTSADSQEIAEAALIPVLNSLSQIALWDRRGPMALHIDTGMNRLGVGPDELHAAAAALQDAKLELVMSHLACASDVTHEMNRRQRARFLEAAAAFAPAPLSLSSTGGVFIGEGFHFDMVRPGIGLYGSGGLDRGNPALAVAARIEAPILQVRETAADESFGYGATAVAARTTRAGVVALGYADGYLRSLSGRGYGVLAGVKCAVLGRVSMDLVIVDVTDCAAARPGAMVEFLGPNAPLDEIAALAGTAPYEVLTTFAGTVYKTGARTAA